MPQDESMKKIEDPTPHQIFDILQKGHPIHIPKGGYIRYDRSIGKYIYHPGSKYEPERYFDDIHLLTIWLAFDQSYYYVKYPNSLYR